LKESIFKLNNFSNKNKSMKNLRKLVPFVIALVAMITFSCTTDYTNPNNLKGTTWRCSTLPESFVGVEYQELRFTSTTVVETWYKAVSPNSVAVKSDFPQTYTTSKSDITITSTFTDMGQISITVTQTGTIKDKTITLSSGNTSFVYTKQ
jgi:hypothetical protein